MDGYDANLTTLAAVTGALRATVDQAEAAIGALRGLGDGDVGPGRLNDRLQELAATWSTRVDEMKERITEAAEGVRASGAAYRDVEETARVQFAMRFPVPADEADQLGGGR
jgi:methyl-accepting chemotaxis protein